jgi:hypothetical protein
MMSSMLRAASFGLTLALILHSATAVTPTFFCDDPGGKNFDPNLSQTPGDAVHAPWTCQYAIYGCTDPAADNYASWVEQPLAYLCQFGGCNDTDAANFDSSATYNDGTCTYARIGCTVTVLPEIANISHDLFAA